MIWKKLFANRKMLPKDKIQKLEGYLYLAMIIIIGLGMLGGWAGKNWPWVLAINLVRIVLNLILNRLRIEKGNPKQITAATAISNYIFSMGTIYLAGVTPNPFWLIFPLQALAAAMNRVLRGVLLYTVTATGLIVYLHVTGKASQVELIYGWSYNIFGLIIGVTIYQMLGYFFTEYEQREQAEEEIYQTGQRLQQITNNMLDLIAQIDRDGLLIYASPSFQNVLGYNVQDLQGRSIYKIIHPDDLERALQIAREGFERAEPVKIELRICHAQGYTIWFECITKPIFDNQRVVGSFISGRDIELRKQVEEAMQASLREKEVLLKEIHHRVKNNLQVISSLLNLQSSRIQDPESLSAFRISQHRVRSMALIHEKLYQSDNLAEIEFGQYIHNLVTYLMTSYQASAGRTRLRIECDQVFLDINTSIPCGLILNELISNSLKYAHQDDQPGEVMIELRKGEDHQVTLVVADDGVGLPPGVDPLKSSSLGIQLVNMLVRQLGGTVKFSGQPGTRVEINFKAQSLHP